MSLLQSIRLIYTIEYSPYAEKSKDGRKYSFELLNTENNKIGMVSFTKPLLNNAITQTKDTASKIQSLLVVLSHTICWIGIE